MGKYRVKALSVGALNNRILNYGQEVDETAFAPGRAEELVTKDFLERIEDEPVAPKKPEPVFNLDSKGYPPKKKVKRGR